ncbi:MAG: RNA 2'-phosphotransferase [Vulcanimicrobiota bacterium]
MTRHALAKYLAYALRHRPDDLGIELDEHGWTDAAYLLEQLKVVKGWELDRRGLEQLVEADDKGRYSLREGKIRANQGHSVEVRAFDPTPVIPPPSLYHGTTEQRFERIQQSGALLPMARHHVHLSTEVATARNVGSRHRRETLLVLAVDAGRMHAQGFVFYRSENNVYLTDRVPVAYVRKL